MIWRVMDVSLGTSSQEDKQTKKRPNEQKANTQAMTRDPAHYVNTQHTIEERVETNQP